MGTKVAGERKIGSHRVTACNVFFATGPDAVEATADPFDVTCQACIKNREKAGKVNW